MTPKRKLTLIILPVLWLFPPASAENLCVDCHRDISPGQVRDWELSRHAAEDVTCSDCHGEEHTTREDYLNALLPTEEVCSDCHDEQFEQFGQGKHNFGWIALNIVPGAHLAPDELIEGGRGCGGCHNMGIKTETQIQDLRDKGYRYQNNSCDECHTRHTFSKSEAQTPYACRQCHMGYDHPQWEMWSSSKHGERWFAKQKGALPEDASAPTCQTCHLPEGTHTNGTAWGFLGVRLPLPNNEQAAADRMTILKALGMWDSETGQPTPLLDTFEAARVIKMDQESWQRERDKMLKICSQCHSSHYTREQLDMGDAIMVKADRLMADAIETVAALYKDGLIKKPAGYPAEYPFLLMMMHTNGENWDQNLDGLSYIDQVLLQMYMKHRMRTYQGFFHVNPDYSYWYGWNEMTKDLGEIKELSRSLRAGQGDFGR